MFATLVFLELISKMALSLERSETALAHFRWWIGPDVI